MRPCSGRRFLSLPVASLLVTSSCLTFQFPLSDESVREAYFLGERHDLSFLGKYFKFLPLPEAGPHIASVTFLTPFAYLTEVFSRHIGSYSAQQARLDLGDLGDLDPTSLQVDTFTHDVLGPVSLVTVYTTDKEPAVRLTVNHRNWEPAMATVPATDLLWNLPAPYAARFAKPLHSVAGNARLSNRQAFGQKVLARSKQISAGQTSQQAKESLL